MISDDSLLSGFEFDGKRRIHTLAEASRTDVIGLL
jgi:hypothetical protein